MARTCPHPHASVLFDAEKKALPTYPSEPDGLSLTLVLHTETGRVPYCTADNPRGRAAITYLAMRFTAAGVVKEATYETPTPDNDPFTREHDLAHLVLCQALAEKEGRFCVADSLKPKIAARMLGRTPGAGVTVAEMTTCSCGDPTRPHINHRKRIPCWTYIGHDRCDICPTCGMVSCDSGCPRAYGEPAGGKGASENG